MRLDLGRDPFLNYVGEVAFVEAGALYDIANVKGWMKDQREKCELILAPGQVWTRYEPLGVVAVFGSWNAPMVTTLKPLVQAITAGNCCIVKPSEVSAHSSAAIKKLVDTYLDQESIICIEGGVEVATTVNGLPLDLICFTGSTQVGKIVAKKAAENLTPCILELGGKCPAIIDHDAQMDFTSSKISFGKFFNSGQICISPDYVFVHETRVKEFVKQIEEAHKSMFGEKPTGCEL